MPKAFPLEFRRDVVAVARRTKLIAGIRARVVHDVVNESTDPLMGVIKDIGGAAADAGKQIQEASRRESDEAVDTMKKKWGLTVHTLTPGMLLRDGLPWIAHASMGGEIQPQVFAQFVSAVVDGGLDIATAVAAPRWVTRIEQHLGAPSVSVLESRYHLAVTQGLRDRGHDVEVVGPWSSEMGHEHAVEIVRASGDAAEDPTYAAASDPRSEGLPAAW